MRSTANEPSFLSFAANFKVPQNASGMASEALTFASFEKFKSEVALRTKRARTSAFNTLFPFFSAAASSCAALVGP